MSTHGAGGRGAGTRRRSDTSRVHAEAGGAPLISRPPRTRDERVAVGLHEERRLLENRLQDLRRTVIPAAREAVRAAQTDKARATATRHLLTVERELARHEKRLATVHNQLGDWNGSRGERRGERRGGRAKASPAQSSPPGVPKPRTPPAQSSRVSGEKRPQSPAIARLAQQVEAARLRALRAAREADLINQIRAATGQKALDNTARATRDAYRAIAGHDYAATLPDIPAIDATISRAWMRQAGTKERVAQLRALGIWPAVAPSRKRKTR